jgi:hypothetical protein
MRQILNAMNEEGVGFLVDMNRDEKRAFQELFNLCEDFLNASEELEAEFEDMEQGFNSREYTDEDYA